MIRPITGTRRPLSQQSEFNPKTIAQCTASVSGEKDILTIRHRAGARSNSVPCGMRYLPSSNHRKPPPAKWASTTTQPIIHLVAISTAGNLRGYRPHAPRFTHFGEMPAVENCHCPRLFATIFGHLQSVALLGLLSMCNCVS